MLKLNLASCRLLCVGSEIHRQLQSVLLTRKPGASLLQPAVTYPHIHPELQQMADDLGGVQLMGRSLLASSP